MPVLILHISVWFIMLTLRHVCRWFVMVLLTLLPVCCWFIISDSGSDSASHFVWTRNVGADVINLHFLLVNHATTDPNLHFLGLACC